LNEMAMFRRPPRIRSELTAAPQPLTKVRA